MKYMVLIYGARPYAMATATALFSSTMGDGPGKTRDRHVSDEH